MKAIEQLFNEAAESLHTICDFVRFGATQFEANELFFGHGTDNAWDESAFLVLNALFLPPDSPDQVYLSRLTHSEKTKILERFKLRIEKRLPAPYITQESWFCNMAFYVDDRVLIPRSPVAELIEQQFEPWIDSDKVSRIVDIGTGSGCIACAMAEYFPNAVVDAVDISTEALDVAKYNVEQHGLTDQVNLIQSNCLSECLEKRYDVIISNPPYVDQEAMENLPEEYHNEPQLALAGGALGLDYVLTIMQQAQLCLEQDGILIVEVGDSRYALEEEFPEVPFTWLEFERGGHGVFLLTHDMLSRLTFD